MKIKLTSFYGDSNPGDVVDVDAAEGARVIGVGGAVAHVPAKAEPAAEAASAGSDKPSKK